MKDKLRRLGNWEMNFQEDYNVVEKISRGTVCCWKKFVKFEKIWLNQNELRKF